jgi:hypothetical protein
MSFDNFAFGKLEFDINGAILSGILSVQDDQIGRIFAYWAIFSLGVFYVCNYRSSANYWATLRSYVLTLAKISWATLWALFFTNTSGHPASA